MNHFSIKLWPATKSEFYMTTDNNQLSGWTKEKLQSTYQSQTCTKKTPQKSRSLFVGLLLPWSTTAFWIPVKSLHLRSMLSTSIRWTENCNTCSQDWSTERAQFSMIMSHHTPYNQHFKRWTNWATKFCLICHVHLNSCQPTTTSLNTSTLSQQAGGRKCFPIACWIDSWIFTL